MRSNQRKLHDSPLVLFKNHAFLSLWLTGGAVSTVRWLEMLATAIYVFEITRSEFTLTALIALRMLPLALFGAQTGVLAERLGRRRLQLFGLSLVIASSIGQAVLVSLGWIEVWHLGLGAFINGLFWTIDMPARRTLIGDNVARERVGNAMSFDSVTANGTRMAGPLLGGLLLANVGLAGSFWLGALLYSIAFVMIFRLPADRPSPTRSNSFWAGLTEGASYVRGHRELIGILLVTVVFNIWGFPFVSMVPVLGQDIHGLGPLGVGALASMEGVGASVAALAIALWVPGRWFKRLYFAGTALTFVAMIGLGQHGSVTLSGILLIVAGVGTAAFASMQSTLTFLVVPDEVRSRVMGVLSVCIGVGPFGFLHMGILAKTFGAQWALIISAVEGLLALILVARFISGRRLFGQTRSTTSHSPIDQKKLGD